MTALVCYDRRADDTWDWGCTACPATGCSPNLAHARQSSAAHVRAAHSGDEIAPPTPSWLDRLDSLNRRIERAIDRSLCTPRGRRLWVVVTLVALAVLAVTLGPALDAWGAGS